MINEFLRVSVATEAGDPEKAWFQLDETGMICDCDRSACDIFRCDSSELRGHHISKLLPQFDRKALVRGTCLEPQLAHECHIGRRFDAADAAGRYLQVELFLSILNVGGSLRVSLFVQPCAPAVAANTQEMHVPVRNLRLVA
jgi:hypothetical protein